MFEMAKVGIIGLGYVGSAIYDACQFSNFRIVCIDIDPLKTTGTYEDIADCDAVFVCVPSPTKDNDECDTSILSSVLYHLKDYKNVIISKTTAPPAFYEKMQLAYPNLIYVPEFLTAENAGRDFSQTKSVIIGGAVQAYQREALRFLKAIQPIEEYELCTIGEAALAKYIVNSFLATKVVFMNEMSELATAHNYDWRSIHRLLLLDKRMGDSHLRVPGPDGQYGFGGMCFPKDTSAFLRYAGKLGIQLTILKTALKKNVLLRLTKPK